MAAPDSTARVAPRKPTAIVALPHDRHGRPIPWFVHVDTNGVPDFRIVKRGAMGKAVGQNLCWVCGIDRGREAAFVVGPMCTINRISPEPPSHRECAKYSADACPFLATPHMRRRETGLPQDRAAPVGAALMRNPGVACVWFTNRWRPIRVDNGLLFQIGPPTRVAWRAWGRAATRDEVMAAMDGGYPGLVEVARQDGERALADLSERYQAALRLIPAA